MQVMEQAKEPTWVVGIVKVQGGKSGISIWGSGGLALRKI